MSETIPSPSVETEKPTQSLEQESDVQVFQSFFGPPVNGNKDDTEHLILQEGFTGMFNLQVFENHCFVRFNSKSEFDAFNKHFNGFIYTDANNKEVKMFAVESKKRLEEVQPSTRIVISNFGRKKPTERELYFLFSPYGYIKHISMHSRHAFVDFDTIDDARNVIEEMKKDGSDFHMSINFSSETPNTEWNDIAMPLTDLIPNDHPFWQQLISTIQGNRPRPY